jgi:pyridoxamine 5'-phosphate oxidase
MAHPWEHQKPDLARLRVEYQQQTLSEHEVDPDPMRQFLTWLNQAIAAQAHEPNAMTLATCTKDGRPSARIVLLKDMNPSGLAFFTHYQSRKGEELRENPHAAVVFYWPELERQVRVEGDVHPTSAEESDAYFASRPVQSRLGSAASAQSQVIPSRQFLDERMKLLQREYPSGDVPRPEHWGGYRLRPQRFEFWQGRPNRLHDRIEYIQDSQSKKWIVRRLPP